MDRLLTVPEAAERLNTSERFIRRMINERRIQFIHVGRHVRIAESILDAFVRAGVVEPVLLRRTRSVR
jgi:excisionase family DNA binding protein